MIRLSVNVNKIATIRNSRGGAVPSVIEAVKVCVDAGAPGITVHPRADARHITTSDVREIAGYLRDQLPTPPPSLAKTSGELWRGRAEALRVEAGNSQLQTESPVPSPEPRVEFNIEGDPRPDLLELVHSVAPTQCTLVHVRPGEITSQAGWSSDTSPEQMARTVAALRAARIRVSLFVDPEEAPIRWAARVGADRVELYTEPFARAFLEGESAARESFSTYSDAATLAHSLGLGVNAGHDLDLDNLVLFRRLPHLDEVSIGHALISHALFVGLAQSVREYLEVLKGS